MALRGTVSRMGLSSSSSSRYVQDGPPEGGFPQVRVRRAPRKQGSGALAVLLLGGVMAYGFYQVGQGNQQRRKDAAEKREARAALLPFLQAEEDARFLQQQELVLQQEAEIMEKRSDWTVGESVYNSDKVWAPPAST